MIHPCPVFRVFPRVLIVALAVTLLAATAPANGTELSYRKIALTGEPAPDTEPSTTFAVFTTGLNHSIMSPRIDEAGRVAFIALVEGVAVDDANRSGIWAEGDGRLNLVVRTGMHAPGTSSGVVFRGVPSEYLPFPPSFAAGRAVFQGEVAGPGIDSSNNDGVWSGGTAGRARIARERESAPGLAPGVHFTSVSGDAGADGSTGVVATLGGTGVGTTNNDSIWTDRSGTLAAIVREGDPAPGLAPGIVFGSGNVGAAYTFPRVAFNDASMLAVQANLVGPGVDSYNDECIWVERDGRLALVARDGDPAPGIGGGTFGGGSVVAGFYTLVHNDRGHVAFTARVGGSNWSDNVIYTDRSGTLVPVARDDDPAPGTGGARFTVLGGPVLNDEDRIAFSGSITGGLWPPTGIFWDQPGELDPLVLPGAELAGMTITGTSGIVGFNAAGELAFTASLEHPTAGFRSALVLVDRAAELRLVAATGHSFDVQGDGSDMRQILRIEPGGLSDSGSVAFRLDFTDGSSGHFAATTRRPGAASELRLGKGLDGQLELSWAADCAGAATYAVYRGDLATGWTSLGPEPARCSVTGTATSVPPGVGEADFFIVVPQTGGFEGSYGTDASGEARPAPLEACFPQGQIDGCAP